MTYYRLANRILSLSAITYIIVWSGALYYGNNPWYGLFYWVSQSAFIGSVADWFAVSALFRKPLGIPFHTALIPRNKNAIIEGIVNFLENQLISKETIANHLQKVSFFAFANTMIRSTKGRELMLIFLTAVIGAIDTKSRRREGSRIVAKTFRSHLEQTFSGHEKGHFFDRFSLVGNTIQEYLFMKVVDIAIRGVQSETCRDMIERELTRIIKDKTNTFLGSLLVGVAQLLDSLNVQDMSRAIQLETIAMLKRWKNPSSAEYKTIMPLWNEFLSNVEGDNEVVKIVNDICKEECSALPIEDIIETHVWPLLAEDIKGDKDCPSPMAKWGEASIQRIWAFYSHKEGFEDSFNVWGRGLLMPILLSYHSTIGNIVRQVLVHFDEERFIQFVENKVGYDLGWIRINGALVGGTIGLFIWIFLHFIYEPYGVPILRSFFTL